MDNAPITENKWKYEWYPEIKDRNLDHPAYRLEFHQWEGKPETWKLEKRNFLETKEEWDKLMNSSDDKFAIEIMSREVHPYTLIEGVVYADNCIPNKQWLKWMVDALNEKALKEKL